MDLDLGLERKELLITLDGTYSYGQFDAFETGILVERANQSLDLIENCVYLLQDSFRVVHVQFEKEAGHRA